MAPASIAPVTAEDVVALPVMGGRAERRWVIGASAGAAMAWAGLVAHGSAGFFPAAAVFSALWLPLSAMAAPPGLLARLRPRWADLGIGLAAGLALYAASRAFLWAGCGGLSDALCAPLDALYRRFETRAPFSVAVLLLLVVPAEELFWRGVVQARLAPRLGPHRAALAAAGLASLLALATGEPLLALATLPTYAAFGLLASWRGSLVPALACHAAWTLLIASLLPHR